jgi:hypothetical protein
MIGHVEAIAEVTVFGAVHRQAPSEGNRAMPHWFPNGAALYCKQQNLA